MADFDQCMVGHTHNIQYQCFSILMYQSSNLQALAGSVQLMQVRGKLLAGHVKVVGPRHASFGVRVYVNDMIPMFAKGRAHTAAHN